MMRMARKLSRIVAAPTAGGSSADTALRNTSSVNPNRIGNAISSARAMSESATTLGAAKAPVERLTAARAVTASAEGSSKSLSSPSSPKTPSAKTAANSTSASQPRRSRACGGRSLRPRRPVELEHGDDVEHHPVGEELPHLVPRHAGQLGGEPGQPDVVLAHVRADL